MRSITTSVFICLLAAGCASTPPPPDAAQTYSIHCASCHGRFAEGDGPMVDVFSVDVPNLRQLSERNDGVFPADAVSSYIDGRNMPAAHGARDMPVWGDVFATTARLVTDAESAEQRIAEIVEYLEAIQYE